jgi:hypothetical protein
VIDFQGILENEHHQEKKRFYIGGEKEKKDIFL